MTTDVLYSVTVIGLYVNNVEASVSGREILKYPNRLVNCHLIVNSFAVKRIFYNVMVYVFSNAGSDSNLSLFASIIIKVV